MPRYQFRARDRGGALVTGRLEAPAIDLALKDLSGKGLIPITIKIPFPNPLELLRRLLPQRISREGLLIFTREFQTLFKAGLGMDAILTALIRQTRSGFFGKVLEVIRGDVAAGSTLSKSFARHPKVFNEIYVSMLAAGEEAGILDETLKYLADLLERDGELQASVRSATLYPKIVVGVLVAAASFLLSFVVPKFTSFYAQVGSSLPVPTLVLVAISRWISSYWYFAVLTVPVFLLLWRRFRRTVWGQMRLGELSFRFPLFGRLNLLIANARFCHIVAALYRSGLPIDRALQITQGTIENHAFRRDLEGLRGDLIRGRGLSEGMGRCRYFTPVVVEAVAAGEKSGALDNLLTGVGGHYEAEVSHLLKNLTTLLEPALLILVFGMVGFFAVSIFLPIWNLSRVVSG